MTEEEWVNFYNEVYTLLVEHGEAAIGMRENFIFVMMDPSYGGCHEYRFSGCFGFGGKLYRDCGRGLEVGYYSEDRTPKLDSKVDRDK